MDKTEILTSLLTLFLRDLFIYLKCIITHTYHLHAGHCSKHFINAKSFTLMSYYAIVLSSRSTFSYSGL